MNIITIFKMSFDNLKKHLLGSIFVCLFTTVIIVGISILCAYSLPIILLVVIPLLIIPLFFSMKMVHYALRNGESPSFRVQIRFFGSYFTNIFMGVYRVLTTFIICLILLMFLNIFTNLIANSICCDLYPYFNDVIAKLTFAIQAGSMEEVQIIFNTYQVELLTFVNIAFLPCFFIISLVFVYRMYLNSLYAYMRLDMQTFSPQYFKYLFKQIKKKYRNLIFGKFFVLATPLFVLFLGGYFLGTFVSLNYFDNPLNIMGFAYSGGMTLILLYLPIYFSNNETIYTILRPDIFKFEKETREELLRLATSGFPNQNRDVKMPEDEE